VVFPSKCVRADADPLLLMRWTPYLFILIPKPPSKHDASQLGEIRT